MVNKNRGPRKRYNTFSISLQARDGKWNTPGTSLEEPAVARQFTAGPEALQAHGDRRRPPRTKTKAKRVREHTPMDIPRESTYAKQKSMRGRPWLQPPLSEMEKRIRLQTRNNRQHPQTMAEKPRVGQVPVQTEGQTNGRLAPTNDRK